MATGTAGDVGQKYHTNQVPFLVKTVTYTSLGTSNTVVVGVLPPRALVLRGGTWIKTGFNDTNGDDLDVGVAGSDDDLFASAVDLNTGDTLTAFDDLADANRYSASARTVTCTLTTAATGNGTAGEATVYLEYIVMPEFIATVG
jgi:hypothetical protein